MTRCLTLAFKVSVHVRVLHLLRPCDQFTLDVAPHRDGEFSGVRRLINASPPMYLLSIPLVPRALSPIRRNMPYTKPGDAFLSTLIHYKYPLLGGWVVSQAVFSIFVPHIDRDLHVFSVALDTHI